jgi:hypothetical protein
MERFLVILGLTLILLGFIWPLLQKTGLGHLPGDVIIKRENFTFYFPLTTSIILSLLISGLLFLFHK